MKRIFLLSCFWILASEVSNALIDTNNNGFSDLWEKLYNNGQLFPNTFDPLADPDGDGWSNAQEATAGTDPFNATPPSGFLLPDVTHRAATYITDGNGDPVLQTPDGFVVHWSGEIGKQYKLQCSPDLTPGSWFSVDDPITAFNPEMEIGITPLHPDGSRPTALFWRTAVNDVDSDGDGFTDYEEYLLGTDPEIADSDADGLPDLWEIYYGLDPHDDGTTNPDNGPNGDPDHDGFSNLAEYVGGSSPADATSTPAGGTASVSVGAPPILLSDSVTGFGYKYGFSGFIPYQGDTSKVHRYLKSVSVITSTETDNDGDGGTTTTTKEINSETGAYTSETSTTSHGGQDYSSADWTINSDTSRNHDGTDYDLSGETSTASETLSNEYTTPLFTAYVESQMPAYTGTFSEYNDSTASISLTPEPSAYADSYYLTKLKYKWEVHKKSVLGGENVNWLEVFTPADGTPPLVEPMTWNNLLSMPTSRPYTIDPSVKNGGKNGTYMVIPVEFQLREDAEIVDGWDSTKGDDWAAVGVGKTSTIARLALNGISDAAAKKLELVVAPGSEAYVSLAQNTITESHTDFDFNGLKATVNDSGCKIIVRTKTTKQTIATLHVNVFEKVEVKVAIYKVFDGRTQYANTQFIQIDSNRFKHDYRIKTK